MWAISRVVVVFPFVPLTWITGTSGSGTVGAGPGSTAATSRASSAITRSGERRSIAAMPVATAPASASAAPRRRHGNTTITRPNSGPVRPRTASLPMRTAAAIRRVTWTATRAVARTR
jgi:hypothetical protein